MASSSVDASTMPATWLQHSIISSFSLAPRSDPGDTNLDSKTGSDGFSKSARNVLILTTVIGGTLALSLLIWALYRRNNAGGHRRRRGHLRSSTISDPTLSPRRPNVTALPIYRETKHNVSSEKHSSVVNLSRVLKQTLQSSPSPRRLESQGPDIVPNTKTNVAASPITPTAQTPSEDTSPSGATIVRTVIRRPSSTALPPTFHVEDNSNNTRESLDTTNEHALSPVSRPETQTLSRTSHEDDADLHLPPTTPSSSIFPSNPQDRWSWTNSQAPPTPRIAPGNRRASLLSMSNPILPAVPNMPKPPYQRNDLDKRRPVSEWIRAQPESIDEEAQVKKQTHGPPGSGLLRKLSTKGPGNGLVRNNSLLGVFRRPSQTK
ncbi:Hypothetical protein R9X50_00203400 [Acrodontium crateriforme]|uniref:Uncharacterized protein n=1 Tax=Acrodontium crateriforme TaxID=150365 RepID=A0AAQ3M075_9PEZI|nr:Hypothetical protein R9X50_00203400 [Acrodontium crateriforme]